MSYSEHGATYTSYFASRINGHSRLCPARKSENLYSQLYSYCFDKPEYLFINYSKLSLFYFRSHIGQFKSEQIFAFGGVCTVHRN